jgi:hypothetical protein
MSVRVSERALNSFAAAEEKIFWKLLSSHLALLEMLLVLGK